MAIVLRVVVGDAGDAGMHFGAAELLRRHHLAGRRFHRAAAAEEDRALSLDDHRLVRHRRHVGAAGGARAHHAGDLRDAGRRHVGDVVEDAAEVLAVGEDVVLLGKEAAARVDEVDARQAVLRRDLLRAQVLLHRHRVIGAALDGGVVGDDHALAARDAADAGDHRRGMHVAAVHAVRGELADLEERRAGIEQAAHPVARQELAAREVLLARLLVAAHRHPVGLLLQVGDQAAHALGVGAELLAARIELALDHQKGFASQRSSWSNRSMPQKGSPSTMK
jgi:hypothetical protein